MEETLAIDFDSTLHDDKNPIPGRRMGLPMEGAADAMQQLRNQGYKLVIHTVRGDSPQHVIDWLNYYGILFDEVTSTKPAAKWYIDDKALRFTNWFDILQKI